MYILRFMSLIHINLNGQIEHTIFKLTLITKIAEHIYRW